MPVVSLPYLQCCLRTYEVVPVLKSCPKFENLPEIGKLAQKLPSILRTALPQTVFNLIRPLIHFQESSMIITALESSGAAKASTMTLEFSSVTLHTSVLH